MSKDLFIEHGLHALHEWPEAQEAALAVLEARRKAPERREADVGGVIALPKMNQSRRKLDS